MEPKTKGYIHQISERGTVQWHKNSNQRKIKERGTLQ